MQEHEKIIYIENKVNNHQNDINELKGFKEEHLEEHQQFYFEHKVNCKKLEYIEKAIIGLITLSGIALINSIFDKIIK